MACRLVGAKPLSEPMLEYCWQKKALGTNFSEFLVEILIFSFKKMRLKVSSAKRRSFCLGLNELMTHRYVTRPQWVLNQRSNVTICHLQDNNDHITECDFNARERGHLYEIIIKYVLNVIAKGNRDMFMDILKSRGKDVSRIPWKYILIGLKNVVRIFFNMYMFYTFFVPI